MKQNSKPRLAWFSPAADENSTWQSNSAYMTQQMLPFLSGRFEIELFSDEPCSIAGLVSNHFLTAFEHHRSTPFDIVFHQVEDDAECRLMRLFAGCMPGAVLFHDFIFCDDGPEPMLNSGWEESVRKYFDLARAWPERSREYHKKGPLALREAGLCALPIFSNERAHSDYKRSVEHSIIDKTRFDGPASFFLPLPVPDECFSIKRHAFIGAIGYCGLPRIEHRAHKFFAALKSLGAGYELIWLIKEQDRPACEELIREFNIAKFELVIGKSPAKWQEILPRVDIAVHTLFSVYGSPGPYLPMSLASGARCIVTNFGATEYLPESVVFKIQAGDREARELHCVLQSLFSSAANWDGELQREFAREHNFAPAVGEQLGAILHERLEYLRDVSRRWSSVENSAKRELLIESKQLIKQYEASLQGSSALLDGDRIWRETYDPIFSEIGWKNVT